MNLVLDADEYKAHHDEFVFLVLDKRPIIYDEGIVVDTTAGICAKAESTHKAKIKDWKVFNYVQ